MIDMMKSGGSKHSELKWFQEINWSDVPFAGTKGANFGEMTNAHLPVPPGFVVTSEAYFNFIRDNHLDKYILKETADLNPEDSKKLNQIAKHLQQAIKKHELPRSLMSEIQKAYDQLGGGPVAVRSSAAAVDLLDGSLASEQEALLSIKGHQKLIKAIRECWASLFEPQAIYYRMINKFDHTKVGTAVLVQKMVESEVSGIMFTINPVTSDIGKIVIEAGLGLGEAIVSGSINPDHYIIDKDSMTIVSRDVSPQSWQIVCSEAGNKHVNLTKAQKEAQKLTNEQIISLAKVGRQIEEYYGEPQDIEWAMNNETLYIIQARPIVRAKENGPTTPISVDILVRGMPTSMGMRSGPVRIIHRPTEIDKVMPGDILVAEMTSPDYIPAMKRAAAIVTDTGGRTSNAAVISRELGIPCVVGAGTATNHLKTGQVVTVDGITGRVYKGVVKPTNNQTPPTAVTREPGRTLTNHAPITETKIYLNLAEPKRAQEYAELPVDGVGLLRPEFIVAEIGEHPKAMIAADRSREYVERLGHGIAAIAEAFYPRPVVYCFADFKTNEYRSLKGGEKYEELENNPMIGCRGASRYIADPEEFSLEIEAIKMVRDGMDLKNLHVVIPFIRTINEFRTVRDLMSQNGLRQGQDFKIWIMCEVPSVVLEIDRYIEEGIDGVLIDSHDLAQFTLGIDRDSLKLTSDLDEHHSAVMASINHVATACRQGHVTCSVCRQTPSVHPEIAETLLKTGVTSFSLSPDAALPTRKLIASLEKKALFGKAFDD